MPYICFEAGALTPDIKQKLVHRLTEVSAEVMCISKEYFFVSIHELPNENVAIAGKNVHQLRAELSARKEAKQLHTNETGYLP